MEYQQIEHSLPEGSFLKEGKYKVEKVIGAGGMGITYIGTKFEDDAFAQNRKVVIKELFLAHNNNNYHSVRDTRSGKRVYPTKNLENDYSEFRRRFKNEAETLHKFRNHANMVQVLDYFEENGTAYFTMEFIKSQDLSKLIKKTGALSFVDTHRLLRPIAILLEKLHENSVLHRDIKPGNILIDHNNTPYLIDFGISKSYDTLDKMSMVTNIGTEGYAPPEQLSGTKTLIGATIDVYALAATYHYCLTGKNPQTSDEIRMKGKKTVRDCNGKVSEQVSQTIAHAMIDIVKNRTQSIAEFINQLDNCLPNGIKKEPETVIDTGKTIPKKGETDNTKKVSTTKSKLPLYIGLMLVLGALGFVGSKFLLNGKPKNDDIQNSGSINSVKLDSVAYSKLDKTNTTSLNNFITQFKEGVYVGLAKNKLDSIKKAEATELASSKKEKLRKADLNAWNRAKRTHTITAYNNYKNKYPSGRYVSQANSKIAGIQKEIDDKARADRLAKQQAEKERKERLEEAKRRAENTEKYNRALKWALNMISNDLQSCKQEPACKNEVIKKLKEALRYNPNGTEARKLLNKISQ